MCSPIDCIISKSQEWCDSAEETESERELEIKSVNSCYPFFVSTILLKILFPGVARECIHSLDPLLMALEGGGETKKREHQVEGRRAPYILLPNHNTTIVRIVD